MKISLLACLLCISFLIHPGSAQTLGEVIALQNARVPSGFGQDTGQSVSIVIRGGKIASIQSSTNASIAPGSRVIDLAGKTVIPALINGHGHLGLAQGTDTGPQIYTEAIIESQLAQYERYGVTTMMSLGMNRDLIYQIKQEQARNTLRGATVLTADRGFGVPDGMPPVKVSADQIYRPATPEEARAQVRESAARHPDLIKIWVDDNQGKLPEPNAAVYGAVIDEAHKQHLRVAAHVYYLADAKRLLKDKVDILAHSIRDMPVDAEFIQIMKAQGVYYIPTLQLEESFYVYAEHPAWMDVPFFQNAAGAQRVNLYNSESYKQKVAADPTTAAHKAAFNTALLNLKKLSDAGVLIGFGTDSGANPNRIQGWAEQRELQLMVQAGLTPAQALQAATQTTAAMLHISGTTGSLQVGTNADLLVVDGDPTKDIAATGRIAFVFHKGREVRPE